jgi:hypothetical protein
MSTTGCRMLGSWVGKPRRKKTESETVREIIEERSLENVGCLSSMLYQHVLLYPPQTKEKGKRK